MSTEIAKAVGGWNQSLVERLRESYLRASDQSLAPDGFPSGSRFKYAAAAGGLRDWSQNRIEAHTGWVSQQGLQDIIDVTRRNFFFGETSLGKQLASIFGAISSTEQGRQLELLRALYGLSEPYRYRKEDGLSPGAWQKRSSDFFKDPKLRDWLRREFPAHFQGGPLDRAKELVNQWRQGS